MILSGRNAHVSVGIHHTVIRLKLEIHDFGGAGHSVKISANLVSGHIAGEKKGGRQKSVHKQKKRGKSGASVFHKKSLHKQLP
ncbi:MAG TPA: hypothetical protein DCM57_03830 [Treponema sp.]|nr:hypothetical protein [Treponema sp.]